MLAAEEDIANRVAELANKRGLTVYQTVNDILEQVLRAEEAGVNLKESLDQHDAMQRAQELGLTFTVEHLYYQVVDACQEIDGTKITDLYRDMGFWYGKYFKTRSTDPFRALNDALVFLTMGSELTVEKARGDTITVSCVSEKFSRGYTEAFATFIEAAYSVIGYKTEERETSRGIIRLQLEKAG